MDDRRRRGRAAVRTLIGPLAMLVAGMVAGGVLWYVLMLEPSPRHGRAIEQLSQHDRRALDGLIAGQHAR